MPKIKVDAQRLAIVLGNVLPHAGTDDTLPVLCCLEMALNADGLTFAATDRYSLAWETLSPATQHNPNTKADEVVKLEGEATVLLRTVDVKAIIAAVKKIKNRADLVEFDVDDKGSTVTIRSWDIAGTTFRTFDGVYVKWRSLTADDAFVSLDGIGFNPAYMARFAVVREQSRAGMARRRDEHHPPMRLRFTGNGKIADVRIGETFRACIMPVRLSGEAAA